jgi:hypothetical protein
LISNSETYDGQTALDLADAQQKTDAAHAVQGDCVGYGYYDGEERSLGNEGGANAQGNGRRTCRVSKGKALDFG